MPTLTSISPVTAVVGSPDLELTVVGSNISPATQVTWNGEGRAEYWVSSGELRASIPASDLAAVDAAEVRIVNPDPGGGASDPIIFTVHHLLEVSSQDVIMDSGRGRIYATVPSTAPSYGNSVIVIDPQTGTVENSVFAGSEPWRMALSDNGQYLYVGMDGSGNVNRIDLATLTSDLTFSLGTDPFYGTLFAEDMAVLPGEPGTLVVSLFRKRVSPRHGGVTAYADGVQRTNVTPDHTGSNVIEPGAVPGRIYGQNNETTEFGFRRMTVDASGVAVVDVAQSIISGFGTDIVYEDGLIYSTRGDVLDPEDPSLAGSFPTQGPVRPVSSLNKVFFAVDDFSSDLLIEVYDLTTFVLLGRIDLGRYTDRPEALLYTGSERLAVRLEDGSLILLEHPLVAN